jgi:TM2 domain-containing membrane protein YozV
MPQGDATFGVEIETNGDPGLVAAMIAPFADVDADELEAQLIKGPVRIAEDLSRDEAMELVHACTRMGADARLIGLTSTQSTQSGTLIGASLASMTDEWQGSEAPNPQALAELMAGGVNATQPFASADLKAALAQAISLREHAAPPPSGSMGAQGHKTLALGSMKALADSLDSYAPDDSAPGNLGSNAEASISSRLTPVGLRAPGAVVSLDPFSMDPANAHRKATLQLLPAVDRAPPIMAPPQMDPSDSGHEALKTSGMGSVNDGPFMFRLEAPTPRPSDTGTVPRPVRLGTSAPAAAAPPVNDTLANVSTDDLARAAGQNPKRFNLMDAAPRSKPRMPTLNARLTTARRSEADHSPGTAALLSLVLPGMGQVYNGQFERAGWYALGALLVVPWLLSIGDAYRTAQAIQNGERRTPDASVRRRAVASQLALNLSVIFVVVGGVVLYRMRTQQVLAPSPATVTLPVVAPPTAPPSASTSAVAEEAPRKPIEVDLPVDALMRKGKAAFERGLYAEAEDIMHTIIRKEPNNKEAYKVLVEANSRRRPGAQPISAAASAP